MTDNKDFKRLVRERMAKTGESYTAARAHLHPGAGEPNAIEDFRKQMYSPPDVERVASHLEHRYGIRVTKLTELDVGVFRVTRATAPSWIARVFPAARPISAVEGDAEILRFLEKHEFPAERCAQAEAVSELDRRGVLVTECVPGLNGRSDVSGETLFALGDLLGRLHTLPAEPGATAREAGSWHHVSVLGGGRREDVDALLPLLAAAAHGVASEDRATFESVCADLRAIDGCGDLPHALIHTDPSGANTIASHGGSPVLVDWTGAGRGPRLLSLGCLIGGSLQPHPGLPPSRDLRRTDAVIAGYRSHVRLGAEELARLPEAIAAFGLIIDCWSFLFQQVPIREVAHSLAAQKDLAHAAAERAATAFDADIGELTEWYRPAPPVVHEGQGTLL